MPADAGGKLELAAEHMRDGRQAVARVLLERALEAHPSAPETAEIRYRLAETWFNEGDWRKAAIVFKDVPAHHPDSDWAAWAILRQGVCFAELGNADGARLFYETVVDKYGRSEAADEARSRLAP